MQAVSAQPTVGDMMGVRVARAWRWWLLGLFVLALAIRWPGLLWGGTHPDEDIGDPARVLTGQLIPNFHYYPPLLNYLTAAGYAVLFVVGRVMHRWHNAAEFREAYFNDPAPFLLVLRLVVSTAGAAAAPLAAMIAARLGSPRRTCLLVGIALALLPASVWWSHIGKQDLGMATSVLFAVWCMLRYTQQLRRTDALWFGTAVALALSFKQSALFIIVPLIGVMVLLARDAGQSWTRLGRDALAALGVCTIVWIPLNIGLWLDFANFLNYQKVLAAMHVRGSGIERTSQAVWGILTDRFTGPTVPLLLGFLIAPLVLRRRDALLLWAGIVVSLVITAGLSGEAAQLQLYLPESLLIATVGMMTWVTLTLRGDWLAWPGAAGLTVAMYVLASGAFEVDRQALARPIRERVANALLSIDDIAHRRILASEPSMAGLPVSGSAERDEWERAQRLARKYRVTLPAHYRTFDPDDGRYYIRSMPWVMGGLEAYEEKDVKVVKPFAWPVQLEEWQLNHWLNTGYTVFVVMHEDAWLSSKVPAYRGLHREIHERCTLVTTIQSDRPLFLEHDTKIYLSRTPSS
jgi:hypothetical protein